MSESNVNKKKHKVIERTGDGIQVNLMKHQLSAMNSKAKIAGIVGGRGCGKSIYLSVEAFSEIIQGHRVLVMAQNYKSLKINIFREIIERFNEAGLTPKVNYSEMSIKFGLGELYGFVYEALDSTRGVSQVKLLLLDELAFAPVDLLSVVAPCLRGAGGSRIRFGTSPKKGSVWNKFFRDRSVEKEVFTATMFDNTELDDEDYEMQKNAIKDEMQYRQEILGEILDDDVEFAVIKSIDYPLIKKPQFGIRSIGIDCAGAGRDSNVFLVSDDTCILEKFKIRVADTFKMQATGHELVEKWDCRIINIDTTGGFGNGTYDMLSKDFPSLDVNGINFGGKPAPPPGVGPDGKPLESRFLNIRADMYFHLGDDIRDNGFFVDDDEIREELQYLTYDINASGKTLCCPKETIKSLIGRSPDSADALALSRYRPLRVIPVISPSESLNIAMKFVGI